MEAWEHPQSYAGHSPIGDYVLYSRNRDSSILENSNYELILDELTTFAEQFDHLRDDGEAFAYDFRTKHWGCGWIEYIIIRQDAPTQIIELAESIDAALSDYPVYSDDDYSERQWKEMYRYWNDISIRERIEWLKESGESIFAARNDDHIPESMHDNQIFYWNHTNNSPNQVAYAAFLGRSTPLINK